MVRGKQMLPGLKCLQWGLWACWVAQRPFVKERRPHGVLIGECWNRLDNKEAWNFMIGYAIGIGLRKEA